MSEKSATAPSRPWPFFQSFAGWRFSDLGADAVAGLTLAAIAIPEQMATARLAGFEPQIGFLALVAGAVGFAVFGASRLLSVGADSTIAPIFAGALALLATGGSPHYAADAALLALGVGLILAFGGAFRLGFVADLLSIPVTTGFLAGIAGHILVSQAPSLLGLEAPHGSLVVQIAALAARLGATNFTSLGLGLGVFATMLASERINPRFPGALIGLGLATGLVVALGLESRGVSTLGAVAGATPKFALPAGSLDDLPQIAPLALIVGIVVMVQTAATTRSFVSEPARGPDVNRDFVGLGAANLLAGLVGAFPVDASPPRTAVVMESGAASQLGALVCAALALALSAFGAGLLAHVPHAALAGVLLFVALRIVRAPTMIDVWRRSRAEFALIVATMLAILVLPIEWGVGIGIILSLMHGVWTITRAQTVEFERIPGTSIWWPASALERGETAPGVRVVALQAPLSFLNAYAFRQAIQALPGSGIRLLVIEANAIVEIDYTGAKVLSDVVQRLRADGVDVAFARLESVRAQQSFTRQGLEALVGRDHLFHSVEEAVRALAAGHPE
ncbi:MAG TPA: SulP family inorganic anion transporter [Roseiarcus sp.]|nr:SulP family inorganic anion transporter [Roseiarcus sp.]